MKVKNKQIYKGDLATLKDEYEDLGFDLDLTPRCLTIFAIPRKGFKPKTRRQQIEERNRRV